MHRLRVNPGRRGREEGIEMSNQLAAARSERGMTTAEYALGTIAVVAVLAVVINLLTGSMFTEHIAQAANQIIDWIQTFIRR